MRIFVINLLEFINRDALENEIFIKKNLNFPERGGGGVSLKCKGDFLENEHDRFVAHIELITTMLLFLKHILLGKKHSFIRPMSFEIGFFYEQFHRLEFNIQC